ncbi:MAG: TonB-dependent receptor [Paludibacteraceae bacterium]|nr:TonB-dependent receptor [Paludibacteraceae bacterium]
MMKRRLYIYLFMMSLCAMVQAQITGVVLDEHGEPLVGANVYWSGTGVGVATDLDGNFTLMPVRTTNVLVASFVGCHNDSIVVLNRQPLTIVLVDEAILDEVTITERKLGVIKSRTSAFDTQTLGTEELCRAACCNLSEAFETNASVDVAYADAATGAKQIRLLGLSGTYVQLLQENTPAVRGLAQNFGMEYIPGPWMQSIQVSKGTASVINGYEATTGQINVELLKPQTQSPLSVNLMVNSELHAEANIMGGWQIPLKEEGHVHHHEAHGGHHEAHDHCHHQSLYTGILAHYQEGFMAMDDNHDSFVDMPKSRNANLANRWVYKHGDYTLQAFVRGLYDRRLGGQLADSIKNPYRIDLNTWRVEGFLKNGYVFDEETGSSVALITAVSYHDLDNRYGQRLWKANQLNAYVNAIYQGNWEGGGLIDNDHRLSAGLSLNYDKYNELIKFPVFDGVLSEIMDPWRYNLDRQELTPGIFAEYDYTYADKLSLVAGVRADWSSRYGFFFTPRVNVRYTPWEWWTVRASAGMGYRSPNLIADNAFLLPSSRRIEMRWMKSNGVQQEKAVNAGVSTTFYIPMGSKQLQLSGEYYYTHFFNSLIVDMDRYPNIVFIFNQSDVEGAKSFAHCAQVEASMEVLRGWTWTAAFRWTDVEQSTYHEGVLTLRPKALSNRFKGVITTSYQTPRKTWQFDVTAQFNGVGRMPDGFVALGDLGGGYKNPTELTWYPQLMAQVTKYWKTCSLYLGAENMTNFRQYQPIVDSFHPWSRDFDASMVVGPITGWKVYLGFRYDLPKAEQ